MPYKKKKMYFFLFILTVASSVGLYGWIALFNNFAVEVAGINGYQMGVMQSVREIPGFLALLVVFVILFISEHRLAALSVLTLGIGVMITGFLPTFHGLLITTLIMSFGFHYFETMNQSLTLQYFSKTESPIVFGRLRGLGAATNILAGLLVLVLLQFLSYKYIFFIIGLCVAGAGLYCLFIDPSDKALPVQRKNMFLRKQYWLYYVLTFFAGARRQIFTAFSVFLMVERFEFSAFEVSVLFVVNNAINFFLNPMIGKAINKFGERKVLSLEYFNLIWIFLVYAYGDSKLLIAFMYVLDHIFFNFSMAIKTYFQKIADDRDIAPTMAVGFTINHIAAVVIPVLGGLLWMVDYRIPFVCAAVLSLVSLLLTQLIRVKD